MPFRESATTEIARQLAQLERMFPVRLITSAIAFGLMAIFLSPLVCTIAFLIDVFGEYISFKLMDQLDPKRQTRRYMSVLACVVISELAFCIPTIMIWQLDAVYSKALAVGLLCTTTFQIANVRSLHLPFGVAALSAAVGVALMGNAFYWLRLGDVTGLALSTTGVIGASVYFASAMLSSHKLHRELNLRGEAAQAASLAKGQFIAQISHELRTPLNAIIGMGSAELAQANNQMTADRMDVLVSSAKGLAAILDDILDISALDGKGLTIRPQPVDPVAELAQTLALFRPQFEAAGLTLGFQASPNLPRFVMVDAARLRQCLSNLLSNALKFTTAGQVSVKASMRGELLEIDVQDTGSGISAEQSTQLFGYFQRGSSAQSGTGLGLAISRGLARQMGGDLNLIAQAKGAHFRLVVQAGAVPEAQAAVRPAKSDPISFALQNVLVVDDIATNRLVASTYLLQFGLSPVEASSGHEALNAIKTAPPDLILLDMNMPEMNGLECFHQIRRLTPVPIPVIAMTANTTNVHRQAYFAEGLNGFLAKPLTLESVRDALAPFLQLG